VSAFVLMLREGVEAALIVAILLAYLDRLAVPGRAQWVWGGAAAAFAVSTGIGATLWVTIGELEGDAKALVEGLVAVTAVALLSWMVFWIGRQARTLRSELHAKVDVALASRGAPALAAIAFVAVVREGVESALFLISTTVGETSSSTQVVGAVLGLAAAVAIGYLFYIGSHLIDLRVFFRVTGVLVILFAAGLVAKGVHEFQELDLLPTFSEHLYSLGVLDPASSTAGRFLNGLFGWTPDPSLLMVVGYVGYVVPVTAAFVTMTGSSTGRRGAAQADSSIATSVSSR
jgi:high-affinity iron transporter